MPRLLFAFGMLLMAASASAQTTWPHQRSADFIIKDFRFASGQVLPELKLRYMTIGEPRRNGAGEIANAVLLLHGSSTAGSMWLTSSLADELFGPGSHSTHQNIFW